EVVVPAGDLGDARAGTGEQVGDPRRRTAGAFRQAARIDQDLGPLEARPGRSSQQLADEARGPGQCLVALEPSTRRVERKGHDEARALALARHHDLPGLAALEG